MTTEWIVCGVLQNEVEHLLQSGLIQGKVSALDSILHMRPELLEEELIKVFSGCENRKKVLVYGDCCPGMVDLIEEFKVDRVDAINCAQMLLGKDVYRRHMRQESFLLLPEWTQRWETIFKEELGMETSEQAQMVLGDTRKILVYLNTGLCGVPVQQLEECSEYTGLPWQSEDVDLKNLLQQLVDAEKRTG